MVHLQCILCCDVVATDLLGNIGALVLEDAVQLSFGEEDFSALAAARYIIGVDAIVERALADMVEFAGLVHRQVVLLEVGQFYLVQQPVFPANHLFASCALARDVILTSQGADGLAADAEFLRKFFGRGPVINLRILVLEEEFVDGVLGIVCFGSVAHRFDTGLTHLLIEPLLAYIVFLDCFVTRNH